MGFENCAKEMKRHKVQGSSLRATACAKAIAVAQAKQKVQNVIARFA